MLTGIRLAEELFRGFLADELAILCDLKSSVSVLLHRQIPRNSDQHLNASQYESSPFRRFREVCRCPSIISSYVAAATAAVPNMTCKAVGRTMTGVMADRSFTPSSYTPTDVYRIADGKLYHRWSQREEYFYNTIVETERGRYVSGHMVFVIDENNRGYAVVARPTEWEAYFLECR
jgi:hypothetical protein